MYCVIRQHRIPVKSDHFTANISFMTFNIYVELLFATNKVILSLQSMLQSSKIVGTLVQFPAAVIIKLPPNFGMYTLINTPGMARALMNSITVKLTKMIHGLNDPDLCISNYSIEESNSRCEITRNTWIWLFLLYIRSAAYFTSSSARI